MNLTYVLIGIIAVLVIIIVILIPFIVIGNKPDTFANEPLYTIENPNIG